MADDLADWFLDGTVVPTVDEFMSDISDIRRGMLASLTVGHLADYIFEARPELRNSISSDADFRTHLGKQCRSYRLVMDVANATKHARLLRGTPTFSTISDVEMQADLLTTESGLAITTENGVPIATWIGVVVQLSDGTRERLDERLTEALSFLKTLMGRVD